ncbi:hypothetical protein O2W14_10535 [Modestobacter sp. VKM Ac-2986]|uniref:hypothetical protein n=1 Tax=Modestobacter sp. VKM Ac-2986 TaxID=3004140 RepID=UPI0022AB5994|nr:hypothetical protein [Modestobacter sp. VKM Ac-2986]MCZ2829268.1 hypothetical protein [Modestobacter sp. VKM Ac-2986]
MTDVEQDLQDRLTRLARHAPSRGDTAAHVLALRSRRRRGRAAQVAGAATVALAVVLAVVPGRPAHPPPPVVTTEVVTGYTGPSLYDVPTRGSLAGDAAFVAGVQAIEWASPPNAALGVLSPPADTRRVLFAGDVPGGHRWALVMGRVGDELRTAWFAGRTGSPPGRLTLWLGTGEARPDVPIALQDAGAATGPLVVVGMPGDRVEYSPGQDRDAAGRLVRSYAELPVVDGVSLGEVSTPLVESAAIAIAYRDGRVVAAGAPRTLHMPLRGVPLHPDPDAAYWLRLRDCLTPQGFRVTVAPSGRDLSWTGGPVTGPDGSELSSAERAQNAAVFDRCAEDVRQG